MYELELAGHPTVDPTRAFGGERARFPLSRMAFGASVVVHVVAGFALSRHEWSSAPAPPLPLAEFFLFEMPRPPQPIEEPVPTPVEPVPEIREQTERPPTPRVAAPVAPPAPPIAPTDVQPSPVAPPEPVLAPRVPSGAELLEARERAAEQVVSARAAAAAAEDEYLTFSIDDIAPPRPEPKPEPGPSIFDGGAGGTRGPSVGQLGQSRTKLGHKLSSLCNALTGGFSLMGWGSFCGGPPDGRPSGLFPEVRPEYLDLMPECVDTRDTAPALALEAPFSTVKCRLVKQEDPEQEP